MPCPPALSRIITLFESLSEDEKRENLVAYAEQSCRHQPQPDETFDLEDVRKDRECTDNVGIFLKVDRKQHVTIRITLGPQVQTLTRAMSSILCKGLHHSTIEEIVNLPIDFVPQIVGNKLVRIRSQTVFYILARIKSACQTLLNRQSQ